ncbi:MAG: hypothetical protein ABIW48_00510 [Burkholderiales bacterium]
MYRKHLIYLTNERLLATIWRNGKVLATESFDVDEAGQSAFANYLKRWSKLRIYFLVDLIEEDFRLDTIPHVRGADRRALLYRKLTQIYRATPYRHAVVQGRETTGRRDDCVLYTSVTNSELLTPWLRTIEVERAPLVGIYSAPLMSPRLIKHLGVTAKHVLLVTLHQGDHLRQNYFQSGQIKFSRMTPLPAQASQNLLKAIGEEVRKAWQYLESLRFFETGEELHVCVVAYPPELGDATSGSLNQPGMNYQFFDIGQVAKSVGVKRPLTSTNADWIFLQLLSRAARHNHFAQPNEMRRAFIWRLKQMAIATGAGVLLGSASLGSANFLDGKLTAAQVRRIQAETSRIESERQVIMRGLPTTNVAPEVMSNIVAFYNQTVRDAPDFTRAVTGLSRVWSRFPDAQLSDLSWAVTKDPNRFSINSIALGTDISAQSQEGGVNPSAIPADAPAVIGQNYQVFALAARLEPFDQNHRRALQQIGSLVQAIQTDLSAKVTVLAQPLNPSAKVGLRGSAQAVQEASDARFALKIVLPPSVPSY